MLLETRRLILRKFRQEDFADYCAYAIDDEMCYMLKTDPIHTEEEARCCFDWKMNRENEEWYALWSREAGRVIGGITVVSPLPDYLSRRPELAGKRGCALSFAISRHFRRQGLMEEAVRALIDYLFRQEGFELINCGYMDYNLPSQRFQEKLGFTYLFTERFEDRGVAYAAVENVLWNG